LNAALATRRDALFGMMATSLLPFRPAFAQAGSGIVPETDRKSKDRTMKQSIIKGSQGELATIRMGAGKGLPLLFIHADPGRASQWDSVMTAMAHGHSAAAFDARGAGDSAPEADGDYSYEARAADLGVVADSFEFKNFVIVAHSAGAAVALTYAAQHPDRVAGIFMVDPVTDPRALP
jgi:pimeloyl-ACP methyl ester carboxylesterase